MAKDREKTEKETGSKQRPVFSIGPIVTGAGESVEGAVWQSVVDADGRKIELHRIQLSSSYYSKSDEQWKKGTSFKTSQLAALAYVIEKCSEFCFKASTRQNGGG